MYEVNSEGVEKVEREEGRKKIEAKQLLITLFRWPV